MAKIKCIIKRPDEKYGHVTHISDRLENLQKTVGGYIETQMCAHYCKWPILWDEEFEGCELSESKWCAECPLNRL